MRANKYTGISKRGHRYNLRKNKTANGFSKMMVDNNYKYGNFATASQHKQDVVRLSVLGTLDTISSSLSISRSIQKEHPTEKGYFKRFVVLSKIGKARLKRARYRKSKRRV